MIRENPRRSGANFCSCESTCRMGRLGWTIRPHARGRFIWPNTVNLDTRTAIGNRVVRSRGRRLRRNARAVRRVGTTRWAPNRSIYRALASYRDVHNAEPCCRAWRPRGKGSVRSVVLRCTRASSAPTSIRAAGSSACSRSRSVSQRRMSATIARSMRFASHEKRKPLHRPVRDPATPGRHSKIFSRNSTVRLSTPLRRVYFPRSEILRCA